METDSIPIRGNSLSSDCPWRSRWNRAKGYDLSNTLITRVLKEVDLKNGRLRIGFPFKGKRKHWPWIETMNKQYHSFVTTTEYTPTNLRMSSSTANRKQSNEQWIESPNSYPQHSTVIYLVRDHIIATVDRSSFSFSSKKKRMACRVESILFHKRAKAEINPNKQMTYIVYIMFQTHASTPAADRRTSRFAGTPV